MYGALATGTKFGSTNKLITVLSTGMVQALLYPPIKNSFIPSYAYVPYVRIGQSATTLPFFREKKNKKQN